MKTAGIIAEYNPFHNGHRHQTELLRSAGAEGIIAVMSGNFVQRAEPAIFEKYVRAQAAVIGGVNLVLELPLPYSVASAEDFAKGGITCLAATGIVDWISCGCESSDEENRKQYQALCRAEASGAIRREMLRGKSYPAACRDAVTDQGDAWSDQPNDLLALTYRKALNNIAPDLPLISVRRIGGYHKSEGGFPCAEEIRAAIRAGVFPETDLPNKTAKRLQNAPIADLSRLERSILTFYRTTNPETLRGCYGFREGLEHRICRESGAENLSQFYENIKTKRYPHSAIRRAVLCGYLGIPANLPNISYLRVLAFDRIGQILLKEMKRTAALPVLSRLSPALCKNPKTAPLAQLQLRGDEVFAETLPHPLPRFRDFTETPAQVGITEGEF